MIVEALRIALRALQANKLRTALTMLGIVIGVGAVIALVAIGEGASASVEKGFSNLGATTITIFPGRGSSGGAKGALGSGTSLTSEDAAAIAAPGAAPAVEAVAPERMSVAQVIAEGRNTNTRITGTTPAYQLTAAVRTATGQFFSEEQVQQRALVAVIGITVAKNLFPGEDAVGRGIRVNANGNAVNLRVIGVLAEKGGTGFGSKDDQVLVPLTVAQSRLSAGRANTGAQQVSTINVKARSAKQVKTAVEQVRAVLLRRHPNPNDFDIINVQDQINAQKEASQTLTILLGAIAGISLVVGGIGIMNIMIVSVTERTREIGIRKAVGARRRDILAQFLTEALVVSLAGGALGILAGIGASQLAEGRTLNGQQIEAVIVPGSIVLAAGVSAAIGLFFGIYPATRAARLHPIEALRYE